MPTPPDKSQLSELNAMLNIAMAFRHSTEALEKDIQRMGLKNGDMRPIDGREGSRRAHELWVAYKSVAHFNLHQAYETFIKFILVLEGTKPPHIHALAKLYDLLSDPSKKALETKFDEEVKPAVHEAVAYYVQKPGGKPPRKPDDVEVTDVRGHLAFSDREMAGYRRRYDWEDIGKERFTIYVLDMTPYFAVLDRLSAYAHQLFRDAYA